MYELRLEQFSGPMEKLLELIEEKKMEITELSLAEVTAGFLNYLKTIENIEPRLVSDFVVIAARLLLIKSKALLPEFQLTEEEERDIKDLETRLIFYQNFKPAREHLKNLWGKKLFSVSRPLFAGRFIIGEQKIFYPAENINIKSLYSAIRSLFEIFEQNVLESRTIKSAIITLESKIQEIISRLTENNQSFTDLAKTKPRAEVIVMFLALLHLLAQRAIEVEQKGKFSDIIISRRPNDLQ